MIYKYYTFELLPYGASLDLYCTRSSKKGTIIKEYTDPSHYTTVNEQLGLNNIYFLVSERTPIEMTYFYTKKNGILVGIDTNLKVTNIKCNDDGTGHFTLSNEKWFNKNNEYRKNKKPPYIKLLFNKVKIECCFVSPQESLPERNQVKYYSNGWEGLRSDDDRDTVLTPFGSDTRCKLARYVTVSWNKSESTQIGIALPKNNPVIIQGWFSYGDQEGEIRGFDYSYKKTKVVSDLYKQRFWLYDSRNNPEENEYTLTVPPLNGNGVLGVDNIPFINYFKVGYTVNFPGEDKWQADSTLVVDGDYYVYNEDGTYRFEHVKGEVASLNSTPQLYENPGINNIWNEALSYYSIMTKNNGIKYISPSNGVDIKSKRTYGSLPCPEYTPPCPENIPCPQKNLPSCPQKNPDDGINCKEHGKQPRECDPFECTFYDCYIYIGCDTFKCTGVECSSAECHKQYEDNCNSNHYHNGEKVYTCPKADCFTNYCEKYVCQPFGNCNTHECLEFSEEEEEEQPSECIDEVYNCRGFTETDYECRKFGCLFFDCNDTYNCQEFTSVGTKCDIFTCKSKYEDECENIYQETYDCYDTYQCEDFICWKFYCESFSYVNKFDCKKVTGNITKPDEGCNCDGVDQCTGDGPEDDCPGDSEVGYESWEAEIKYDNTNIVNKNGNLVRYGRAGERVTVIGEYTMPGTGQLYYQIGSNEYINYSSIERV